MKLEYAIENSPPHVWLDRMMTERGVTNAGLTKALKEMGHSTANKATVGKWRTGALLLPLRVLPAIGRALSCSASAVDTLTLGAFYSAYPFLNPMFQRQILKEQKP